MRLAIMEENSKGYVMSLMLRGTMGAIKFRAVTL